MWFRFRWETTNLANVAKHGLDPLDVEHVVSQAIAPFPLETQDAFKVCGPTK